MSMIVHQNWKFKSTSGHFSFVSRLTVEYKFDCILKAVINIFYLSLMKALKVDPLIFLTRNDKDTKFSNLCCLHRFSTFQMSVQYTIIWMEEKDLVLFCL